MSRLKKEIHPLLNDVVLDRLFEVCDADQLLVIRQVCKKWNEKSRDVFRRKVNVHVGWRREIVGAATVSFPLEVYPMMLKDLQLAEMPFRRIKVRNCDFMPDETATDTDGTVIMLNMLDMRVWGHMQAYMQLQTVTSMDLSLVRLPVRMFNLLIFETMVSLKDFKMMESNVANDGTMVGVNHLDMSLQHKNISTYSNIAMLVADSSAHVGVETFLSRFLPCLPNLANLEVGLHFFNGIEAMQSLVRLMNSLEEQKTVPKLRTLNLREIVRHPLIMLTDAFTTTWSGKFPLETLKIDIGVLTPVEQVKRFFGSYAATLQNLHIHRGSAPLECSCLAGFGENPLGEKVLLPHLVELIIEERFDSNLTLLAILDTPNLKQLTLSEPYKLDPNRYIFGPLIRWPLLASMTFANLEVLRIERFNPVFGFTQEELEIMGRATPNIKKLAITVAKPEFPTVITTWPRLESLYLFGYCGPFMYAPGIELIDDETLTGIPVGQTEEDMGDLDLPPNLTNLQNLRSFSMETQSTSMNGNIFRQVLTDHCVTHGFLKMPKLYYLCIPLTSISKECRSELEKQVGILRNFKHFD